MGLIDNFQNVNEMLKQVQHDTVGKTLGACHPEPVSDLGLTVVRLEFENPALGPGFFTCN